jgi:hypothetical protein
MNLVNDVSIARILELTTEQKNVSLERMSTCTGSARSNLLGHLTGISACRHEEDCLPAAQ